MAQKSTPKAKKELNLQLREIMGNAYSFVRGRQYTAAVANVTIEQLIEQAINEIKGTQGKIESRPTLLARIQRIRDEVVKAVDAAKQKPPEFWILETNEGGVKQLDGANTPATPAGTELVPVEF
jgi:hypothetical protein